MKVALVSPYDYTYPGGVIQHIQHLEEHLTRIGHQVKIITPSSRKEESDGKVIVVGKPRPIPASGSLARITLSLRLSGRVKEILSREAFDVVHIHEPLAPALPITVLRFSQAVNIGTFHACSRAYSTSNLGYYYARRILKRWFRRLDGKIAVSKPAMDFVCRYFPGYYNLIPNGIDLAHFAAPVPPLERYCDGKFNLLFVGRLEKRKGIKYLLRAFSGVKKERPQTRLIVVGPDGGLRAGFERWIQKEGLGDVHFVGYVPPEELPHYYHTADLFCAPATGEESFGIVLLEAMASSRPIVASNIDGYASVVTQGEEGFLVPPKNAEALALSILHLMGDKPLRVAMGEKGRAKAEDYSWDRIAGRVLSYYERILAEKASASLGQPGLDAS